MALSRDTYAAVRTFPADERFGLSSQMTRSAVSIASNIAEGSGRDSSREFLRYLRIAYASACELETQAQTGLENALGPAAQLQQIISGAEEVRRMLASLMTAIKSRSDQSAPKTEN